MTNKILIDRELLDSRIESLEDLVAISKTLPPKNWVDIIKNNTKKLRAALDAPQQESVAWRRWEQEHGGMFVYYETAAYDDCEPLYTNPAPSVPEGDEENQAVRMFLMMYGGKACTIEQMRRHLECAGYAGCWPEWAANASGHLSKGGAQSWIRHMLSAAPKAPTTDDRKDAEREGFYEKMWKDFVSLQRGDAKQICIDAERYRWIQENYTAYDNNYGHWCARLEYLPCADSLGEAIDAAIAAQKGEKE